MHAIKDIAVFADSGNDQTDIFSTAANLAAEHQAHVSGVYPITPLMSSLELDAGAPGLESILEHAAKEISAHSQQIQDQFTVAMSEAKVSSRWFTPDGYPADLIPEYFRFADVGVVQQPEPNLSDGRRGLVNGILLRAGRPVLVVPYEHHENTLWKHIVVGWDASQSAARAVHDALPVLCRAEQVEVVCIEEQDKEANHLSAGVQMTEHLARYGINAVSTSLSKSDTPTGIRLLNHAFDKEVNLIVAGAWGHSRAVEYVMGGVTRDLLENTSIPLWMSH